MPRKKPNTFKGSICSKGHDRGGYSLRYVTSQACVDCQKEWYRKLSLKRKLEKARKLLEVHNEEVHNKNVVTQLAVEPNPVQKLFVAVVDNQELPDLLGLSARQLNGKLTAFASKKLGCNSFAVFKFDTEENAWTFHNTVKGAYLAVSEPSEDRQISITTFR